MAFNQDDKSFGVQLATRMQLILDQPMSDMATGLVNRDYEGDFFKIGNTVQIVKPDINSVNVQVGDPITPDRYSTADPKRETFTLDANGLSNNSVDDPANLEHGVNDARLEVRDLTFDNTELVIDKTAKYAFIVSDFTKAEGRWNYESGGLDLAAHQMRKEHNAATAELIANDAEIRALQNAGGYDAILGTPAAPITIASPDELYENVILEMYAKLYDAGAITADGMVPFGSNSVEAKQTYGKIYMPTRPYVQLLKSKYFTDRSTVSADEKVETGRIKTITNLDVAIEPSLVTVTQAPAVQSQRGRKIVVPDAPAGTMVIIAGTRNAVTRASKVLPPDSFKSHTRFATEYHGCEIYGEKVFQPEAVCVAFVKLA